MVNKYKTNMIFALFYVTLIYIERVEYKGEGGG